jgi:hypothetical protein
LSSTSSYNVLATWLAVPSIKPYINTQERLVFGKPGDNVPVARAWRSNVDDALPDSAVETLL